VNARTALTFALSTGQAHNAPEGRTLLQRFGETAVSHFRIDGSGV